MEGHVAIGSKPRHWKEPLSLWTSATKHETFYRQRHYHPETISQQNVLRISCIYNLQQILYSTAVTLNNNKWVEKSPHSVRQFPAMHFQSVQFQSGYVRRFPVLHFQRPQQMFIFQR